MCLEANLPLPDWAIGSADDRLCTAIGLTIICLICQWSE